MERAVRSVDKYGFIVLICLLTAACQPKRQLLDPASVTPRLEQVSIRMADETRLEMQRWLPEQSPRAIILALHGFNDYSQAFALAGEYLSTRGIALYAYDQRGFGAHEQRGIWPGQQNLVRDMHMALRAIRKTNPEVPLYLLGESMGGAVAVKGCSQGGCEEVKGIILVAPALWGGDSISAFYRAGLWLMAHTMPGSEFTGEDLDIMASDNLEILYAMGEDPNVIKQTRIDAVYGLVGLMSDAYEQISELSRPMLLLYGAKDEVIQPAPIATAIRRIKAPFSVGYYPDGYHMLLRDLQRKVVLNDIVHWIGNRYQPLPSGADMGWKEELLGVEQ